MRARTSQLSLVARGRHQARAMCAAALAVALCLCGLHAAGEGRAPVARVAAALQDGDLVFRRGGDITSPLILAQAGSSRFTHVGMVRVQQGRALVVHAMPGDDATPRRTAAGTGTRDAAQGGVYAEPFSAFVRSDVAVEYAVFRLAGVPESVRRRAAAHAALQVGKGFDSLFLISDASRLYCTELVASAYAYAGVAEAARLPRVRVALFPEPILLPETLSRWRALARVAPAATTSRTGNRTLAASSRR